MARNKRKPGESKPSLPSVERVERLAGRVFIILLSIFVAFIAADLLFRRFGTSIRPWDPIYTVTQANHVQKPYVMFAARPGTAAGGMQVNRLGYLGEMPTTQKPQGERRVFVLGGSAVFEGHPPFSKRLETRFSKRGQPGVKVFNVGISSSVSRQELVRILTDIAGYSPDVVISYSGFNDTFDTGWDPRINYPHRYILYEGNPALSPSAADFKLLATLSLGSAILRRYFADEIFSSLTEGVLPPGFPPRDSFRQAIIRAYVQNLRLSRLLSEDLGARFVAFYQPTLFSKKHLSAGETLHFHERERALLATNRKLIREELALHPGELDFHDLSDLFADETREVFSDFCHYRYSWVQDAIADRLFPYIEAALKKPLGRRIRDLYPEETFSP